MIARFPSTTRPVMLIDPTSSVEARFVLGQRCLALERPWQLATLLDLVCDALPEAPVRRPWRDQRAAAVIEAVASNYAHFNLNRMADQLGLHPYYLSRWFRRQAGVALTSYLIRVRLHAARHLLEQGDTKMDHLAPEVGFYDASHLSRSFLEVFGRRPGQRRLATPRDR
jgi:transcriptional regulator GlxA family with amidase domain